MMSISGRISAKRESVIYKNMKKIKITIDGKRIDASEGQTILSAAKSKDIFIPTFCHLDDLKPESFCFICVVDIEGEEDLLPACSTEVEEGMVISTTSERVLEARRTCVELLLSDHMGDCLGPCMIACPAGIDIPGFIKYLAIGETRKALELIKRNMPFPSILGRVCNKPCEDACRRQLVEEELSICHLKRFAADTISESDEEYIPRRAPSTGKKVAIAGAGPTGLSTAYYLQILGHECTLFEANKKPGGMFQYGIPAYRLPRNVLDREIAVIKKLGAKIKCNVSIGDDIPADSLRDEYDAVLIATGAQLPIKLSVEGEDAKGVIAGIDFLKDESSGNGKAKFDNKKVIVVGGGDVAMDAARVAVRKGAKSVDLYCLEKRDEMPASEKEIKEAEEEGIVFHDRLGIKSISSKKGKVEEIVFKKCTSVFDDRGAFNPSYDEKDTSTAQCDILITAIGQKPDEITGSDIDKTRRGTIIIKGHTHETSVGGVFAGGDCVTGPGLAVDAVAAGRHCAVAIDQLLMGVNLIGEDPPYSGSYGELDEVPPETVEGEEREPRVPISSADAKSRVKSFDEIEENYTPEMAQKEALRCLECGCRESRECKLRSYAIEFDADEEKFKGETKEYELDESHPDLIYESHKCIQCRTCVRTTEKILGESAMRIVGRGFTARVKPAEGGKLELLKGKELHIIADNCPVGALRLRNKPVQSLDPEFKRNDEERC